MLKRSWRLVALLGIVSLLLSGMGSNVVLSAVDPAGGPRATPAGLVPVLTETFESGALPTGWQVLGSPGWAFNNPGGRDISVMTGKFAIADSAYNTFTSMDTELRTPTLNLSSSNPVFISFTNNFKSESNSRVDIDVSVDNGATWSNVWNRSGWDSTGSYSIAVPQAVSQSAVRFRFRYYNARYSWWWQLDNVNVYLLDTVVAPGSLNAVVASPNVNLTWTDNNNYEDNFIIERSPDGSTGWVEAGRVGPNVTSFTHKDVTCGTTVFYRAKVLAGSLQSGPSNITSATMPACPAALNGINENFNAAQSLPAGWTMPGFAWAFNQANTTGATGNVATALPNNTTVSELRTPAFSMNGVNAVLLSFQTDIKIYSGQADAQEANIEISTNGGTTWASVWRKTAAYKGPVNIDISPWAKNQPNVLVRFRATLPYTGSYWQLDNVVIGAMPAPNTTLNLTAALNGGGEVLLTWNGFPAATYRLIRSADGGNTWSTIADITDGATSYVDTSVASFTAYQYRVGGFNAAGSATPSGPVGITSGDRTKRYVDVNISLYNGAVIDTAADRAKYENIIRYFADILYEESNGVHFLRRVTFYRDGANFNSSHIQWTNRCWPRANAGGYVRPDTDHLFFCDIFYDQANNTDLANFLTNDAGQQSGGETLGHEWGHFFYGLYDEYQGSGTANDPPSVPRATDPGDHISIMKSQFGGLSDPTVYNRLNHSVNVPGFFNMASGQGRVFGASGWETLARPTNQDPRNAAAQIRTRWPELAAVAPAPGATPRIDLPNAAARGSLEIIWNPAFANSASLAQTGSHTAARAIVIDRSALMADSGHLDAVKFALAHMIDQTPIGDSLSIIAFDGTATLVQPLTVIADQASRDTLIAAVDGITAGNQQAAAGDALQLALDQLDAAGTATRSVYHITHGGDTSGTHAITTVPGYEAAAIPLHVFGFDPHDEDEADLRQLAELTMGEYTVVRSAAELETALTHTHHDSSPHHDVTVAHAEAGLSAGQTFTAPIVFDATLHEIDFDITYLAEPVSATVTLINPLGTASVLDPNDCETYGTGSEAHTTCHVEYQAPTGEWTLQVQATNAMHLEYHVTGITQAGATTYEANLWARDGDAITYPQPIVMYASASRDHPIGGLQATGQVHEADGHVFSVAFHDDGQAPDRLADDGIYSAFVDYTEPGEHRISVQFDNSAGTGFYTDKSFSHQDETPDATISENFEREAHFQVSVLNWRADDHTNWPGDPNQPPTLLTVDNMEVHGRIDAAGDTDVFLVTVPADYTEPTLGVRIDSLALGMDPNVVAFASDFAWRFEHIPDPTATSEDSIFVSIDVQPGETFYIEVLHRNAAAETGTYAVSAGPHLWSDPIAERNEQVIYTQNLPIIAR